MARYNSGAYQTEYKGKKGFYRFCYMPKGMAMSDLAGQLRDGRFFALEVKRGGWKRPTDEREEAQERFLKTVSDAGGIGCFVTSLDDALKAIGVKING